VWQTIEKSIIPRVKHSITVCDSIARYYDKKFGRKPTVIRNVPIPFVTPGIELEQSKETFRLIYIGALNVGRGIETMIQSLHSLENTELHIVGTGDIEKELHQLVNTEGLQSNIKFYGRVDSTHLIGVARKAHLGLSLEENLGLNYYYALPNKLFTYIHANIPVVVSDFPEMSAIVNDYKIGKSITPANPKLLAETIETIKENKSQYLQWVQNTKLAAKELNWIRRRISLMIS
jgi:glycosyltransferase involved in cell wall biosynthesis